MYLIGQCSFKKPTCLTSQEDGVSKIVILRIQMIGRFLGAFIEAMFIDS